MQAVTQEVPVADAPSPPGSLPAWVDGLLSCRFAPLRPFQQDAEGRVFILVPRFDGAILRRLLVPLLRRPDFGIRLDALGSEAWGLLDGERTGEAIASLLEERFPGQADVRARLAVFLRTLVAQGHVRAEA